MSQATETYLGDGVMARFDGFQVWVSLSEGHAERSAKEGIALEPGTLERLIRFAEQVGVIRDPA